MTAQEKTIRLAYPIPGPKAEGGDAPMIEEVTLRRPKAKSMRLLDEAGGGEVAQSIALVCACSGLPVEIVDELDAIDLAELGEACADFLDKPKRGETGAE